MHLAAKVVIGRDRAAQVPNGFGAVLRVAIEYFAVWHTYADGHMAVTMEITCSQLLCSRKIYPKSERVSGEKKGESNV